MTCAGGLSQDQRLEAMSKLKQYQCRVLISTDLTSRGIDAEKVNLVINLDVPQDWETYMHRIGRAGRFGTQGLAVTYCCHGEEENKMMAIAQKCGLSLSVLPSTIEPGLMDEPCDWDVCTDASTPGSLSQLVSKTEKKRRVKADVPAPAAAAAATVASIPDQPVRQSAPTKPEKSQPPTRRGARGEVTTRKVSPVSPPQEVQTRKQLQDALPKIPPLSSFKSCRSRFMTFEEAEQDFWSFINTGLGRSVEVIREFRGRDVDGGDDQNGHRESFMLNDDGTQSLTQKRESWKSNHSPPRSVSSSSSSQSDMEENQQEDETVGGSNHAGGVEHRAVTQPHTDAGNTPTVPKSKPRPSVYTSPPKTYQQRTFESNEKTLCDSVPSVRSNREDNQAARSQTGRHASRKVKEEFEKQSKRPSEKMNRERKRERYEDDEEEEEEEEEEEKEESSAEIYWRTCYKAWNDYYACMSPCPAQGYQSYYSAAHNWMAAYRMNAAYMEELFKQ
nr:PREDICTED: probable ATP-dependent RNA helicase DDX20 [Paralichthys olivaceus]